METASYEGPFPSVCCDHLKGNANPCVWNSFPESLSVQQEWLFFVSLFVFGGVPTEPHEPV